MTVIYIDILFLINFAIDYMALYLCGSWLHLHLKKGRLILSSVLLAVYSMWALLYCASYILLGVTVALSATLVCMYAYRTKTMKQLVTSVVVYVFINAILATAISLLYRVCVHYIADLKDYSSADSRIVVFTLLGAVSGILVYFGNRLLSSCTREKELYASIYMGYLSAELHFLVDSGNRIVDPISGKRVVILNRTAAEMLMGKDWASGDFLPTRRRLICVDTIVGKKVLPAFIIDKMIINTVEYNCLIAVHEHEEIEGYDGIIPAALIGG